MPYISLCNQPCIKYKINLALKLICQNSFCPDPEIANFTAMPHHFLGLETTCPESLPFGKFLLTCIASKPENVVPELEVIWLQNGVEHTDNSDIVTNGTHTVNTLNFKTTTTNDTGNFTCVSRIVIPESSIIQLSEESNIIIRGMLSVLAYIYITQHYIDKYSNHL